MSKTEAAPTRGDFQGMAGLRRAFATPSALTMLLLGFGPRTPEAADALHKALYGGAG